MKGVSTCLSIVFLLGVVAEKESQLYSEDKDIQPTELFLDEYEERLTKKVAILAQFRDSLGTQDLLDSLLVEIEAPSTSITALKAGYVNRVMTLSAINSIIRSEWPEGEASCLIDRFTSFINITIESPIDFAKFDGIRVQVSPVRKKEARLFASKFFSFDFPEQLVNEESFEGLSTPEASSSFARSGEQTHALALLCRNGSKEYAYSDSDTQIEMAKRGKSEGFFVALVVDLIYKGKTNYFYLLKECGGRNDVRLVLMGFDDPQFQGNAKRHEINLGEGETEVISEMYFEAFLTIGSGNLGIYHPKIYNSIQETGSIEPNQPGFFSSSTGKSSMSIIVTESPPNAFIISSDEEKSRAYALKGVFLCYPEAVEARKERILICSGTLDEGALLGLEFGRANRPRFFFLQNFSRRKTQS